MVPTKCRKCQTNEAIRAAFMLGKRFAWDEAEKRMDVLEQRCIVVMEAYVDHLTRSGCKRVRLTKESKLIAINRALVEEIARIDELDIKREPKEKPCGT